MPNYSAESIPVAEFLSLLDANWNTWEGNIPEPTFVALNDPSNPQNRYDINRADYVFAASDTPTMSEEPIGNWSYGNRTTRLLLEIHTKSSRQRLYNLMQETRRICHEQMHSMTNYQRVQFISFNELTDTQLNMWEGHIIVELLNSAILLET